MCLHSIVVIDLQKKATFVYPNCGYKLTFLFYIGAPLQGYDVLDTDSRIDILTTSFPPLYSTFDVLILT